LSKRVVGYAGAILGLSEEEELLEACLLRDSRSKCWGKPLRRVLGTCVKDCPADVGAELTGRAEVDRAYL
jgi:hypothetical protein